VRLPIRSLYALPLNKTCGADGLQRTDSNELALVLLLVVPMAHSVLSLHGALPCSVTALLSPAGTGTVIFGEQPESATGSLLRLGTQAN